MSRRTGTRLSVLIAGLLMLALVALPGAAAAKGKDRNGDKIPDRWEKRHKLSLNVNQAAKDQDQDGLRNRTEFLAGTNPRSADSNDDGVGDGNENGDKDGVDNENEEAEHTDPGDKDTDGDGKVDGKEDSEGDGLNNHGEDQTGNDPTDPDSDDDGIEDGDENAGMVASFDADTGRLRIELFGGGDVVGTVTEDTRLTCENEESHEGDNEGDGGHHEGDGDHHEGDGDEHGDDEQGDEPGDEGGDASALSEHGDDPGDEEGGDDPGDENEEPGDDEPGDDESGDDDPGEGDGEHGGGEEHGHPCSIGDITPGTPVHEAEMKLTAGDGLIFTRLELVK